MFRSTPKLPCIGLGLLLLGSSPFAALLTGPLGIQPGVPAGAIGACCNANGNCSQSSAQACFNAFAAYQGANSSCAQIDCRARCTAGCEFCWEGTPFDGSCDQGWDGDGPCDCACQFSDRDCAPAGACCMPVNGFCDVLTEETCRSSAAGVFQGMGVACEDVNCVRCDPGCYWCWTDTIGEHECLPEWSDDGDCDCGCQFADPDCAAGVCGNLVCEEDASSCPDDCKDLRAFADFQNCFHPGKPVSPACATYIYDPPAGIGLEDYARFADFISGP